MDIFLQNTQDVTGINMAQIHVLVDVNIEKKHKDISCHLFECK